MLLLNQSVKYCLKSILMTLSILGSLQLANTALATANTALATANTINSVDSADSAKGYITKLAVTTENQTNPGFTICVKDNHTHQEVCLFRYYRAVGYQQLLDATNTAIIANKPVEIRANVMGALDSVTIINL